MLYVLEIKNPLQTLKLFGPSACQRAAAVGWFMKEGDLGAEGGSYHSTAIPVLPRCSATWHSDNKCRAGAVSTAQGLPNRSAVARQDRVQARNSGDQARVRRSVVQCWLQAPLP